MVLLLGNLTPNLEYRQRSFRGQQRAGTDQLSSHCDPDPAKAPYLNRHLMRHVIRVFWSVFLRRGSVLESKVNLDFYSASAGRKSARGVAKPPSLCLILALDFLAHLGGKLCSACLNHCHPCQEQMWIFFIIDISTTAAFLHLSASRLHAASTSAWVCFHVLPPQSRRQSKQKRTSARAGDERRIKQINK